MRPVTVLLLLCHVATLSLAQVERPLVPVPPDPLEMASGTVQTVDTPEKRAAFTAVLNQAHKQITLHAGANSFDLKVSFYATGPWINQGAGEMEEIWSSPQQWRWTAKVGGYSQLRIGSSGDLGYDELPVEIMPFPLQMLRAAIFNPMQGSPATASMRKVTSSWNGATVDCALMDAPGNPVSKAPGRYWPEREYCVTPDTALLEIASVAPGYYVAYDYGNALRFHDRVFPAKITISENGRTVLEARIESLTDAGTLSPALFVPTPQMLAHGAAPVIIGPERIAHFKSTAQASTDGLIQPTIVHALIDQAGNVREAEALQSTSVSAAALEYVKQSKFPQAVAAGTAPRQREAFINVQFEPIPRPAGAVSVVNRK